MRELHVSEAGRYLKVKRVKTETKKSAEQAEKAIVSRPFLPPYGGVSHGSVSTEYLYTDQCWPISK